ncbi:pyridoxine/pyridoxamine 5'-phosphate oxidase 1, chloroplastic isoform X1 [Selaginella moellendorffii]|uniref:pyridoxine/pyridoxamine 5'-phosphate oxidase 1, chloroplastic isoform X1 n=1 Tax=Selaginella moellendorffii TaxID=88036 RepID=UPI000D1C25C7|nr:pyridoxine/pyridoxamine 5'-phosphate oxidase 1, chloroplastic isoform X1 [Selaginella moellendorffii]|eukprot:XP_024524674.1 pyridoxine/pyridoxamine 5'-phosphate oxidase 1, chloroplastic isoform X1 [Selaginella moellendorffii]
MALPAHFSARHCLKFASCWNRGASRARAVRFWDQTNRSSGRISWIGERSIPRRSCSTTREEMAAVSVQHLHDPDSISYLSQSSAIGIDEHLMGPLGFSVDQLMELAGLSVASAIAEVYSSLDHARVLLLCGPGNNGGDGLVAARHLHHFGYKPSIVYPKRTDKPLYHGLVTQLESLSVPFLSHEDLPSELSSGYDIVVDAMFGFSFKGVPRPPFDKLVQLLTRTPNVVSVDVPSGWHVEEGDVNGLGLNPDMLVSLTAPKLCAKMFKGPHHFLGGRFVPPAVVNKFNLKLPPYPGTSQCVRIGRTPHVDVAALRENYVGSVLLENQVNSDPIQQFKEWFEDAVAAGLPEPNAMTLATADAEGRPSARMVLLKGYDARGFVWYTNYDSRKANELNSNPNASLVFFWDRLHRQVRVEGDVSPVSREESDDYFHSRPRESQIGALVSSQSAVISGRHILDESYEQLVAKYADRSLAIPRPEHWGGFRLAPRAIEFWQGRESRLHDRIRFTRLANSSEWKIERLSP